MAKKTKLTALISDQTFNSLVAPFNSLIGYAKSAEYLTPGADIEKWKARLIELAEKAEQAWEKVL